MRIEQQSCETGIDLPLCCSGHRSDCRLRSPSQTHVVRRSGHCIALRIATLGATGACLMQLVGCASGLVPVLVSFAESTVLSLLLDGLALR